MDECVKVSFLKTYKSLGEVLTDHELASLGDAYTNFVYSLALSNKRGKPCGVKVKGTVLAQAFRKAGLRENLGARIDSHALADAAEALIVYAWLRSLITLNETVAILERADEQLEGFTQLLKTVKNRVKFF
ncbi:MAG: ribonuclease III family protein [Candidatus Bathycorpusculaceae bacterium]